MVQLIKLNIWITIKRYLKFENTFFSWHYDTYSGKSFSYLYLEYECKFFVIVEEDMLAYVYINSFLHPKIQVRSFIRDVTQII